MKLKNAILCLMALVISYASFSQTSIPKKFQPDDKVKKYLDKSYFRNKNAGYLSITDLMQKMIGVGLQRQIYRGYWAELGVSKSYSGYKYGSSNGLSSLSYISRIKFNDYYNTNTYVVDSFSYRNSIGINAGIFKATIGYPMFSAFSYGFKFKYNKYAVDYTLIDRSGSWPRQPNQPVANSVIRTSVMPTINYRTHLYKGLSMEFCPYIDFYTSKSNDSKIADDGFSNQKKSGTNGGLNLNLNYSF